jgi:hypothetical protein
MEKNLLRVKIQKLRIFWEDLSSYSDYVWIDEIQ